MNKVSVGLFAGFSPEYAIGDDSACWIFGFTVRIKMPNVENVATSPAIFLAPTVMTSIIICCWSLQNKKIQIKNN